jgi:hypothetical protein
MKILVNVARKLGMPNYGSEGASCSIELDLPDGIAPDALVADVRRAYGIADQVVSEQLERHTAPAPPVIEPDRSGLPSQGRSPSTPEPERQRPRQNPWSSKNDIPKSGRELYPWSRRQEEEHGLVGFTRRLVAMGKRQGFPDRLVDWSGPEIDAALEEWGQAIADRNRDNQRAAGQNSNGYSNGHGGGSYR